MTLTLEEFEKNWSAFQEGKINADEIASLRTLYGIYTLRGLTDQFMIRIKVPAGILSPRRLNAVASVMDRFASFRQAHVTTRQDIEIYGVQGLHLPVVLKMLSSAGLTTFCSGGNSVRNITCCPLAGVAPEESFDVTPYAMAASEFFLNHRAYKRLPRKIKIAFEGCAPDHVKIGIQDIGVHGALDESGHPFFRLYAGGGLGPTPMVGQLLEERTSPELLIPTLEAVVKTFDELGERKDRSRARLKYLVSRLGMDEFRRLVLERRNLEILHYQYERWQEIPSVRRRGIPARVWTGNYKFKRWLDANVRPQKQKGYAAVYVRLPMGDLTADTLRRMAMISLYFASGHVRATSSQNLILRWVHEDNLAELYTVLDDAGLASCCAEQVSDILRCAGADTCLSAITSCRGAAYALEDVLRDGLGRREEIQPIHIGVSGCPHACGQHPVASIGMQGMAKSFGEYVIPCYRVTVGGRPAAGKTKFGQAVGIIPARRVSSVLKKILEFFLEKRRGTETFEEFAEREWNAGIREEIKTFEEISAESVRTESLSQDLGSTDEFRIQAKRGECSV